MIARSSSERGREREKFRMRLRAVLSICRRPPQRVGARRSVHARQRGRETDERFYVRRRSTAARAQTPRTRSTRCVQSSAIRSEVSREVFRRGRRGASSKAQRTREESSDGEREISLEIPIDASTRRRPRRARAGWLFRATRSGDAKAGWSADARPVVCRV